MNIVFFGSSNFSILSLEALAESEQRISCVVTQPDRRQGRGLHYASTPVKSIAQARGFKIYQPEHINTPEALEFLSNLNADLFVVIAYGQILSSGILNIPADFCLNVHASLLPQYRGAAPINWAIINGEKETGITSIKMVREMDAGPVILQTRIEITPDDTILTLDEKLARQAAQVLIDSIKAIDCKNFDLAPQDELRVSFAPKLKKDDGLINWQKKSAEIYNLIRGCLSWPVAFTYYKGMRLKIYAAKIQDRISSPDSALPGEIVDVTPQAITVRTGEGVLLIEKMQLEARRMMAVREFLAGHKISPGEKLG
jgi:methionyl-tRNA formyltransferase